MPMMLDEDAVHNLLRNVIDSAAADEVEINVRAGRRGDLRFGCNTPTSSSESRIAQVSVNAAFGKRQAAVQTTDLSDTGLREALIRAEKLARVAAESNEYMPRLGSQDYETVNSWDPATAALAPPDRARFVGETIVAAAAAGLTSSGFYENSACFNALANSAGLFAYQPETRASYSATMRSKAQASGWAALDSFQVSQVDGSAITRSAMNKALMSHDPVEMSPGVYPTIMEPSVTADMMLHLVHNMNRRTADEERSFFGFAGQRLGDCPFPDTISLRSDPAHPLLPTLKWAEDGLPLRAVDWIVHGRIENLAVSRYWAQSKAIEPLPHPRGLVMDGGEATLDELIADTEYALLLGSLFYIREVDPRTLLYTGLTRDGLFLVEHGKVTRPVVNFRWNESPAALLRNVDRLTQPVLAVGKETSQAAIVPALRTREFHYTSVAPSS